MEWQPDDTQNFTHSRLQEVKLKLLPKMTPREGGVSLYQSILFAGHLQHAVDGHSLCSAPWYLALSLLCTSITGCSLHSFALPFCPAAHTGVSRYLPQVQVFALAFIQAECLPGEVLALIPSLQHVSCLFAPSSWVLSVHFWRHILSCLPGWWWRN